MKSKNWMNDAAMNLLVDYYTEVQYRPYGSGVTRANVVPSLKQLDLGYLCIYVKGHSGYTTWKSSLKTHHQRLAEDMPKLFRSFTHEAQTRLVLYFSGLLDGLAGERHPEWRQWTLEGKPVPDLFADFKCSTAYAICPLSGYWSEWARIQLDELVTQYDPDGIWVDGDWPGPCYCPRCQARFRADTGWKGAWTAIQKRPAFHSEYAKTWNRITHDWRTQFSTYVKSLKADCLYSAGNVSPRREFQAPFDWRSGDFFSPGYFELGDMSRMMRWYGTLGVPYDAYVCDTSFTHARKHVRSRSKTLDRMLQESATVAANGGAVGYWTYPLGNGAWVPSRMRKAIAVRNFLAERQDVFRHTQSAARTAILVSDPSTATFGGMSVEGAHKALAALHLSPDVMDETGLLAEAGYDLIVLPEQPAMDLGTARRLTKFVQDGGALLTTGSSLRIPAVQSLLGVQRIHYGKVQDGHVLLRTSDEPTGVDSAWDEVELKEMGPRSARELYPLFLSWDQMNRKGRTLANNWPMHGQVDEERPEPAGFPAALIRRLGQGQIVHICTDIFAKYRSLGDPQILRWLREVVDTLQPDPFLQTNLPSWIDVSIRKQGHDLLVHVVNQNPGRDICRLNTDDTWVDEIPTVGPYTFRVKCPHKPGQVTWEPGAIKAPSRWNKGVLTVELPSVRIHTCLKIRNQVSGNFGVRDFCPALRIRRSALRLTKAAVYSRTPK